MFYGLGCLGTDAFAEVDSCRLLAEGLHTHVLGGIERRNQDQNIETAVLQFVLELFRILAGAIGERGSITVFEIRHNNARIVDYSDLLAFFFYPQHKK